METPPASVRRFLMTAMLAGAALFGPAVERVTAGPVKVLQFTADAGHINGGSFTLDHPALNGKPTLKPIITQVYTGAYNNHAVGVGYQRGATPPDGRWFIYNEDGVAMPLGASFNVLVPTGAVSVDASPRTSTGSTTIISAAKGKPNAFLHFTHLFNPYPAFTTGTVVKANQSVGYSGILSPTDPFNLRWYLFNEDLSAPIAARYFVFDASKLAGNILHTATVGNSALNYTLIDEAGALTANTAVVFVTPRAGHGNRTLGVYHTGVAWAVFNEDTVTAIPAASTYNVLFFPAPIP